MSNKKTPVSATSRSGGFRFLIRDATGSGTRQEVGSMLSRRVMLFSLLACLAFPSEAAVALTIFAQEEIEHLIVYVENSGCEFYRNGSWYGPGKAEEHLRLKYSFLKDSLGGTEDFIEKAASRSSLSGQSYQVRCGRTTPVPSAGWLREELMRFRAAASHS